ncbi:DUF192 domain-containing protein [Oryzibacter oryziterrae]|uniref:DUF192 domain-containing protein n=1 Tax=Oryzibacter oryziterrae TaxID=2766474 RepID=UPI001F2EAE29|nr:DUF192 domain-containing protein [Oryzibacter oryziterrae]
MQSSFSWRLVLRALIAALVVAFVVFRLAPGESRADSMPVPVEGPTSVLSIATETGVYPYNVEVADTEKTRELGLMYRREMPRDHGMLFDMKRTGEATFWMHDTLISLDIVFIGEDGRVVSIAPDARPRSDSLIPSGPPVRFVLELNADQARYIKLKVGDRISHPVIDRIARKVAG